MWRAFWAEAARPSGADETPYQWAVIAAGHFLIGAGGFALLGDPWWLMPLLYFALKELRDLRRGGRWGDSLIDAGFVALGAAALPVAALAAIAAGITLYHRVRKL